MKNWYCNWIATIRGCWPDAREECLRFMRFRRIPAGWRRARDMKRDSTLRGISAIKWAGAGSDSNRCRSLCIFWQIIRAQHWDTTVSHNNAHFFPAPWKTYNRAELYAESRNARVKSACFTNDLRNLEIRVSCRHWSRLLFRSQWENYITVLNNYLQSNATLTDLYVIRIIYFIYRYFF